MRVQMSNFVKLHYIYIIKLALRKGSTISNNSINFPISPMMNTVNTYSLRASYVALSFLAAPKAFAADLFGPVPDIGGVSATDTDAIRTGILSVLDIILSFMALIAVIVVVIAGIRLVVSQGEEQEKDKAKKTIFYAIIGLVVILFAQAIVGFVQDIGDNI